MVEGHEIECREMTRGMLLLLLCEVVQLVGAVCTEWVVGPTPTPKAHTAVQYDTNRDREVS